MFPTNNSPLPTIQALSSKCIASREVSWKNICRQKDLRLPLTIHQALSSLPCELEARNSPTNYYPSTKPQVLRFASSELEERDITSDYPSTKSQALSSLSLRLASHEYSESAFRSNTLFMMEGRSSYGTAFPIFHLSRAEFPRLLLPVCEHLP